MIAPTIVNLARLQRQKAYFDREGYPTAQMQIHWQKTMEAIENAFVAVNATITEIATTQEGLAVAQAALEATQATLAIAVADIAAAQNAITLVESDITGLQTTVLDAVLKDQTPAWVDPTGTLARATFGAYAGQVVSNPPTDVEVQAIDDHVKVLSQTLAALVTDLRANGVLT